MGYFLLRRIAGFVLTLFAVSVVVFAVMNVLPGDPALTILGRIWSFLPALPSLVGSYPFTVEHGFLTALIAGLFAIETTQEVPGLRGRIRSAPRAVIWAGWYAAGFVLIFLGRWQGEAFVYMQF